MTFTDNSGTFTIPNLLGGEYSVKVTMPRFLPAQIGAIQLSSGSTAILSLNLQTAMDVFRRVSARDAKDAQDMVWILRSSRGTQPVLRLLGSAAEDDLSAPDYSGYLQIYSSSFESNRGLTDGVGSRFSLTMPLQGRARVTVDGQYNESPDQPRGLGATYEFAPQDIRQARVSVNMRQGTLLNGRFPEEDLKEIQIKYDEKLELLNHLVFNYGAETGRSDGRERDQYFRPMLGVSFVPNATTTFGVAATAEGPARADDPIRGKDYFEQKAYLPPVRQKYRHAEVQAAHIVAGTTKFSGWRLWNLALEGITSFSTVPLRLWTYLGSAVALLSFIYGSFIVVRTLVLGVDVPGYASLLSVVLFLGGIQLIGIGVLGEYIGRIYSETKQRPVYVVQNVFGGPHGSQAVSGDGRDSAEALVV